MLVLADVRQNVFICRHISLCLLIVPVFLYLKQLWLLGEKNEIAKHIKLLSRLGIFTRGT